MEPPRTAIAASPAFCEVPSVLFSIFLYFSVFFCISVYHPWLRLQGFQGAVGSGSRTRFGSNLRHRRRRKRRQPRSASSTPRTPALLGGRTESASKRLSVSHRSVNPDGRPCEPQVLAGLRRTVNASRFDVVSKLIPSVHHTFIYSRSDSLLEIIGIFMIRPQYLVSG